MRLPILLVLGALLAPAFAQAAGFISDKEIQGEVEKFMRIWAQVRKGELKQQAVIEEYARRDGKGATARERAINSFMYGFIQEHVMRSTAEARRAYERALGHFPACPPALVSLARLAADAGDRKEAERLVRKALEIDKRSPQALIVLGKLYAHKGNQHRAIELFKQAITAGGMNPEALTGLAASYSILWGETYDEKEKAKYAQRAVAAAEAWITSQPKDPRGYLFKAQVHQNLGQIDEATETLEKAYADVGLEEEARLQMLVRLRQLYQVRADVDGVIRTIERMLKHESLPGQQRDDLKQKLKDLKEKGPAAFLIWQVEGLLKMLENKDRSLDQRRWSFRRLMDVLNSELLNLPELQNLRWLIVKRMFKSLVASPPELTEDFMRFLRANIPDPRLIRILVHFIYPHGKTEELREESVRTLAAVTGRAGIPALLYCLRDDSGRVLREVDKQLAVLAETRSPLGGRIEPLTEPEIRQLRLFWTRWMHTDDASDTIVTAFRDLGKTVERDTTHTRSLRAAPMVDHATNLLLDNQVKWPAWKAAYQFLLDYWGKDFRPVEQRNKPVQEHQREQVVAAIAEFVSASTEDQAKLVNLGGGKEPKKDPVPEKGK